MLMKKIKFLALIALALVAVMALSSCGKVSDLNKIYNEEYSFEEKDYKTVTTVSELKGYDFVMSRSGLAVFEKYDAEDDETKTAIYSFDKNSVIKTYKSTESVSYEVTFAYDVCVIVKTTFVDGDIDTVTKTYMDATGFEFLVIDEELEKGEPTYVSEELIIINGTLYNIDVESGAVSKNMTIPANVSLNDIYGWDDYYYSVDETTVVIYDEEFEVIATWSAPSYVDYVGFCVFESGDVLAQYSVELAEDAMFYDYLEDGVKYDLVSKIITVKGKERTVDLNYVVSYIFPNYYLHDDDLESEENTFTDDFANIAYIWRIKDKKIDYSEFNADVVLMNNNGSVQQSLKMIDGQLAALPMKIAEDLYIVDTLYGSALINSKGEIQKKITSDENFDYTAAYGYIIGESAIYDTSFKLVYDLDANNAEWTVVGNTIFVEAVDDDDTTTVLSFCGGKQKEIIKFEEDSDYDFFCTEFGYCISEIDGTEATFTYYSANGTKLVETEAPIIYVASDEDKIIAYAHDYDDLTDIKKVYYLISK